MDQAEDSVEDVTSDDASVSLATLESYSPDESQAETSTNNIVDKTVDNEVCNCSCMTCVKLCVYEFPFIPIYLVATTFFWKPWKAHC